MMRRPGRKFNFKSTLRASRRATKQWNRDAKQESAMVEEQLNKGCEQVNGVCVYIAVEPI
jgi:hypothetical protein